MFRPFLPSALATLVLCACSSGPPAPKPTPLGTPVDQSQIRGTVSDASFPNARAYLATSTTVSGVNVGEVVSPGILTLTLSDAPDPSTLTPLLPSESACTATGSGFDSSVRIAIWDSISVVSTGNDPLGRITEVLTAGQPGAGDQVVRVYSDAAATVKGTVTCPGPDVTTYDVTLHAGWNAVTRSTATRSTRLTTLATTARSELRGQPATPSVTLTLAAPTLAFPDANPVSVSATFGQVGGYSGRVHLSTDVAGLSVLPATVILPPLGLRIAPAGSGTTAALGSGLAAQQFTSRLTFRYTPSTNIDQDFHVIVKDDAGKEIGQATSAIQVTRPGFTVSTRMDRINLASGSSVQIPVCVSSEGEYQGPVTLGASGLPAGVSVTPTTLTLNAFTCDLLTLTSTPGVLGGTTTITLTGNGGGYKAQVTAPLTTLGSAVSATLTDPAVTIYQGMSATVNATVMSEYGFSGPTTLTLDGLPAGISAAPLTVRMTAGTSTAVSFTLNAAPTAALGTAVLTVNSPNLLTSTVDDEVTLRVRPPRLQVTDGTLLTPSTIGAWQRTRVTTAPVSSTLTRSGLSGGALAVTVPGAIDQLIATDGGVLALSLTGSTGTRVQDDGRLTPLPTPPFTTNDDLADSTDGSGLLWFTRTIPAGGAQISTWNPASGEVRIVDSTSMTSTYGARVSLSADRR
uniref:hypothetical protein n=1 Tax=Deinococcus sp. TaxID=47478 RepID=UPI002869983C